MKPALYPCYRGYGAIFGQAAIPIAGEYLEIPSTTASNCNAELSTAEGGACDEPTDAVGNSGKTTALITMIEGKT